MEAAAYNPMAGTPSAAAAPATPPLMAVQPPPMTPPATPLMEKGGATSSGGFGGAIRNFFEDINIVDVVTSAFIVGGVLYAVHYFKFMMMMEKTGYADLNTRIQKIEAANKKQESATANATGNRRRPMFGM
jgi:hypothetical protein